MTVVFLGAPVCVLETDLGGQRVSRYTRRVEPELSAGARYTHSGTLRSREVSQTGRCRYEGTETGSDICYNRQLSRRPPAPVSVETEAPTSPATRAVADVRNAPPLLKRRGRRTPTRARCVVRSSHCLVSLWPLSKLQSVELAVRVVQPARAGSGMMSRQQRTTKLAEGGRYIMRFRTTQNVFLHLVCH